MKVILYFLGSVGLLLGAFYGFASSPYYVKILTYSLICELASLISFAVLFSLSAGYTRLLPIIGILLAMIILIQSTVRLVRILSSN